MNRKLIEEAQVELAVALRQSIPSDDQIIIGHMRAAHEALNLALTDGPHIHVAGSRIGEPIDTCAACGHDIRHEIHTRAP